ncbi:MAG: spermidine synthase [Micavibrio sp.]
MSGRIGAYAPLFSITLILSAFLLFSVQPLFGKMVLPLLGGTPAVWNTAMVFFQTMLLGGYAYAHLSSKFLPLKAQALLHVGLLSLCVLVLPLAVPEGWHNPPVTENPLPWLLGLMTVAVGGPFFVLAGTAPMLQRWFSTTAHPDAHNPYFLYAASNLGSMMALILYPLAIEPLLGLKLQSSFWMFGYIGLIALIMGTGFLPRHNDTTATAPYSPEKPANSMKPDNRMRLKWLLLAFIPSSLMLGVTTYITTDIASTPLLWVIPLALYLLTFIIVFSRFNTLSIETVYKWQKIALIIVGLLLLQDIFKMKLISVGIHIAVFFFCALTCHLSLAHKRPTPAYLTEFYLIMSLGGVLGGVFNSLIAPFLFVIPLEYALMLAISAAAPFIVGDIPFKLDDIIRDFRLIITGALSALAAMLVSASSVIILVMMVLVGGSLFKARHRSSAFIVLFLIVIAIDPGFAWRGLPSIAHIERNFFGVTRIENKSSGAERTMMHGTTLHGSQALVEPYRLTPLSYYASDSPGGEVFGMLDTLGKEPQKVAVVGLGLGSLACFPRYDRDFVFYEIDPAIKRIAEDKNLFTYLSDCGSPYEVIMGDGRLKMAEANDGSYDMIFLDAFSSDSIPSHLLTKEAFEIYFRKLKPTGLIVVHISNRFMDLSALVQAQAEATGATARFSQSAGGIVDRKLRLVKQGTVYGMMTRNPALVETIDTRFKAWHPYAGPEITPWTDDYANILQVIWLRIINKSTLATP